LGVLERVTIMRKFVFLIPFIFITSCNYFRITTPTIEKDIVGNRTKIITINNTIINTITSTKRETLLQTPTITNTKVIISGTVVLKADFERKDTSESYFDIDNDVIIENLQADIKFQVGCGSDCFGAIIPVNKSIGRYYGKTEPNIKDCQKDKNKFSKYGFPEYFKGAYYCILTNENNYSYIFIKSINIDYGIAYIALAYKIWK
jgi:hypothetical protein